METRTFQHRLYRRRYAELIAELNAAVAEEPSRPDTWMMLGNTYLASGHPDRCALCLHRAASLESCPPATHEMLGRLYLRMERYPEAEACFHRAATSHLGLLARGATCSLDDDEAEAECAARALVGLARCRMASEDREGARYLLEEALDLVPEYRPAEDALATLEA